MPYVVIIFIIGFLIGIWASTFDTDSSNDDTIFKVTSVWENFPPEALIYMFLPVLIYEEVTNLNLHHFKTTVGQGLVLAFPAAVAGTFMLGAIINANGIPFPVDWGNNAVYLFSSILCATDAVSVVSLLSKMELFRSQKLKYIIINESLFNDATAFLLYAVFLSAEISDEYMATITFYDAIIYAVKVVFISPVVGLAFGAGTVLFMLMINNPHNEDFVVLRSIVTVSSAYLSFLVGQYLLSISGILITVFNGLVFMYRLPAFFKHYESVHYVWHTLGWISNTMIFYVAGLAFGYRTIDSCSWEAFANIIIIYVLLFAVRAIVLLFFYPLLNWLGKGVTKAEMIFMIFSGLRGAVSIALALNVALLAESNYLNTMTTEQANTIFLYAGGVSGLSLVLNATVAEIVLKYLNLSEKQEEEPYESKLIRNSYKRQLMEASIAGWLELPESHRAMIRTKCRFFNDLDEYIRKSKQDDSSVYANSPKAMLSSGSPVDTKVMSPPASEASLPVNAVGPSIINNSSNSNKSTYNPIHGGNIDNRIIGHGGLQAMGRQDSTRNINLAFAQPIERTTDLPALSDLCTRESVQLDLSEDELGILIQLHLEDEEGDTSAADDNATVINDSEDSYLLERDSEFAVAAVKTLDADSDEDESKENATNGVSNGQLTESNMKTHLIRQNSVRLSRHASIRSNRDQKVTGADEEVSMLNSYIEQNPILRRFNSIDSPMLSQKSSTISHVPHNTNENMDSIRYDTVPRISNITKNQNSKSAVESIDNQRKDMLQPLLPPRNTSIRDSEPNTPFSPLLSPVDEASEYNKYEDDDDSTVNQQFVAYVRSAFLECVRSYYLDKVRTGTLNRNSDVVLYLMNSVDAGLESVSSRPLNDWGYINKSVSPHSLIPFVQSILNHKLVKPYYDWLKRKSAFALKLDKQRREDFINTLNFYIFAHQYAQIKIPSSFDLYRDTITPEVNLVVKESQRLVEEAKRKLRGTMLDPRVLQYRYTKEKLLVILTNCENMLFDLQSENIIMKSDFNYFLNMINEDRIAVNKFNSILRRALEMSKQKKLGKYKLDSA